LHNLTFVLAVFIAEFIAKSSRFFCSRAHFLEQQMRLDNAPQTGHDLKYKFNKGE